MRTVPGSGCDGRVVVVAGAGGGGIGTAVCRHVTGAGGDVVALDVDPVALEAVEAGVAGPGRCRCVVADARDPVQVHEATTAARALGTVHGLVHVAGGIGAEHWGGILEMSLDTFDDVMERNLRAALVTMRSVGALLVSRGPGGASSSSRRWRPGGRCPSPRPTPRPNRHWGR